jgi:hypothetical protein
MKDDVELSDVLEFIRSCENPYYLDRIYQVIRDRMY